MLKADLHVHSEASNDGNASVPEILDRAREVGMDVVCITDHDEIGNSLEARDLAPDYGLTAVPGVEVTTEKGHVLAYGVYQKPPEGRPVSYTIDTIRELGGLAFLPHPFQKFRHGVGAISDCDGIEVYNSRLFTGIANRRAEKFALSNRLPMIGNSDAHIVEMVGRAYTKVLTDDRSLDGILEALKQGKTTVEGRRTPWKLSVKQLLSSGYHAVTEKSWRRDKTSNNDYNNNG
ncbi:MAG: CehA/McbA family metallohydrolase [Halobacteria archaeon]